MKHGAGVFQRLLHVIEDDRPFDFHGIPLWFAPCGCPCVLIEEPHDSPGQARPPCSVCFPQPEGVAMAECEHLCGADASTARDGMKVCKDCAEAMDRIANGEEP